MFLRRILPVVLLLAAAALGFFMFVVVPARFQRQSLDWWFSHTEAARWQEREASIKRWGWEHDDFGDVGSYGGKEWAAWIMERINAEHDLSECREGHKEGALRTITNHAPPLTETDPATDRKKWGPWPQQTAWWKEWWSKHQHESQEEWVRAGFASAGIEIEQPLSHEGAEKLLALIGQRSDRTTTFKPKVINADTLQPLNEHFLRYNAMRWLRDSDFDVAAYAMEKITPETPDAVKQGVKDFYDMRLKEIEETLPGRLFGKRDDPWYYAEDRIIPIVIVPWVRRAAAASVIVLALLAVWLWRRPRKQRMDENAAVVGGI